MAWKRWDRSPRKSNPKRSWSPEEMKMIGFVMKKGINISIDKALDHVLGFFLVNDVISSINSKLDPTGTPLASLESLTL